MFWEVEVKTDFTRGPGRGDTCYLSSPFWMKLYQRLRVVPNKSKSKCGPASRLAASRPFLNTWLILISPSGGEVAKGSASDSRKVDLFHLQECGSEGKFLERKNMVDVSQFSRAPRAMFAKKQSNYIKTFTSTFPYFKWIYLCIVQYVASRQTPKAVPFWVTPSWKSRFITSHRPESCLTNAIN